MRYVFRVLVTLSLTFLPGAAFAWIQVPTQAQPPGPEIEVVDGKISMSALGVPLGRVVSMMDRAMGLQSKVAPELTNRNISVRFKDLPLKDAVIKIFEGQPLNYIVIEGKGIQVLSIAQGGATPTPTTSSFSDQLPITQSPINTVQPTNPVQVNPVQVNPGNQPVVVTAPFPGTGVAPNANPAVGGTPSPTPGAPVPGQMPPPIGANAPPIPIIAQPAAGLPVVPAPAPQPAGPGTLGATPGAIR
jgi:hypothetical protein